MIVLFTTSNGYPVIVDAEKYSLVSEKKWYYDKRSRVVREHRSGKNLSALLTNTKHYHKHANNNPLDFRMENIV